MLIANPIKDFYEKILHERVLVLVSLDVDSLTACKILQSLFKCDHVQYTLVPVATKVDLKNAFDEHKEQYQHVIMLNCGGNIDVLEFLQPPEDTMIYIADSHRPIDLVNFYCDQQVYVLMKHDDSEEMSAIPEYDALYHEDDESQSDEESSEEQGAKRPRLDEEELKKRKKKREWEDRRKEILFDYEEFSYYGTSTSLLLYELAWKMSKDNNDLLWWGITGVTDQYQNKKIGRDKYVSSVLDLQGHMSRLNHRYEDQDNVTSVNCMKINFEHDLNIAMYRHWSLFESLRHSICSSTAFKLWTSNGMKRLHQFLAEMGIPLVQCKQTYSFMESGIREKLSSLMEESAEKFGLDNIKYQSFSAQCGFNHKVCASDIVFAVGALLEDYSSDEDSNCYVNFVKALDSLAKISTKQLQTGITQAKVQLTSMIANVSTAIEIGQVISYGPFLYTFIKEGMRDYKNFGGAIFLNSFTHHLLHCYLRSLGRSKRERAKNLPLVVCASHDADSGVCIITGVPPLAEDSKKNLFGRAFTHAAERTSSRIIDEYFDPCIITLKSEDRSKFLDALIAIMS